MKINLSKFSGVDVDNKMKDASTLSLSQCCNASQNELFIASGQQTKVEEILGAIKKKWKFENVMSCVKLTTDC